MEIARPAVLVSKFLIPSPYFLISLHFPLQMRLLRYALTFLDDIGGKVIEILELLAGRGIGVVGVVVELNKLLRIERQPLDAALLQTAEHCLHAVAQLIFCLGEIGLIDDDVIFLLTK